MVMFTRDGYESTTNRAIAQASGLTGATIYHYFSSKAELYAAVYEEVLDRVYTVFEKAIVGQPTLVAQYAAVLDATVAGHHSAHRHPDDRVGRARVLGLRDPRRL
jgi:AcrR family transcriptional regulator